MCEFCYTFFKEPNYRKRSWIVSATGIEFYCSETKKTREDFLYRILNPPEYLPFYFYLSKNKKRQGWLDSICSVNFSRENFTIATDFTALCRVNIEKAKETHKLISFLREKKISKTILQTGNINMHSYKKAMEEGWCKKLEAIKKYVGMPIWEVMAYVAK